jgi:serine/threonine protein kinase
MAHEQLLAAPLSPATDVWALGLVAFFLLTGRSYWRASVSPTAGISAIFAEILHMPIAAPSQRARDFGLETSWPPAFDGWFLRCVNRDPAARFASAGAAARGLLDALLAEQAPESEDEKADDEDEVNFAGDPLTPIPMRSLWPNRARWFAGIAGIGIAGAMLGYVAVRREPPSSGPALIGLRAGGPVRAAVTAASLTVTPAPAPSAAADSPSLAPAPHAPAISGKPRTKRERPAPEAAGAAGSPGSVLDSPVYSER